MGRKKQENSSFFLKIFLFIVTSITSIFLLSIFTRNGNTGIKEKALASGPCFEDGPKFFPDEHPCTITQILPQLMQSKQEGLKTLDTKPALEDLIKELNTFKLILVEEKPRPQKLTAQQREYVGRMLLKAASREILIDVLCDPTFEIFFVPESYFIRRFWDPRLSGIYDYERNFVAVSDYLLSPSREDQGIQVLADEISHAAGRSIRVKNLIARQNAGKALEPTHVIEKEGSNYLKLYWRNEAEFKKLNAAYGAYKDRIKEYRELAANKKKLSDTQQVQLNKYNRAVLTFKHLIYNKEGLTDVTRNMPGAHRYIALNSKPPPASKIKQLKKWQRNLFFQQDANREIDFSAGSGSTYAVNAATAGLLLVEKISDFAKLSPTMQKTFGSELCDELDQLYGLNAGQYCTRASL